MNQIDVIRAHVESQKAIAKAQRSSIGAAQNCCVRNGADAQIRLCDDILRFIDAGKTP
jgi:hypothetical protein